MWLAILRSQVATVLALAVALAAVIGCDDAGQPPVPHEPSPSPTVVPLSPGQVGVSLGILRGWPGTGPIVSEAALEPGDEITVVVNADTNGEVVTVGLVELNWDASALAAVEFLHGDLIGSTPYGGYALTGPRGVNQGSLKYTVYDYELPDETPPGVLARFKFRVVDGRFREPRAEVRERFGLSSRGQQGPTIGQRPHHLAKSFCDWSGLELRRCCGVQW